MNVMSQRELVKAIKMKGPALTLHFHSDKLLFLLLFFFNQSPNAAVACPSIHRSLTTTKSACKKPDTDSVFVRVPTRDTSLASTLSPHPKNPSASGIKLNASFLSLWFILVLRSVVFE